MANFTSGFPIQILLNVVGSALYYRSGSGLEEALVGGSRIAPRALFPSFSLSQRYPYLKRELTSEASDGKRVGRDKEEGRPRVVDNTRISLPTHPGTQQQASVLMRSQSYQAHSVSCPVQSVLYSCPIPGQPYVTEND